MKPTLLLLSALFMSLVVGCGQGTPTTISSQPVATLSPTVQPVSSTFPDRVTAYQGTPLPTPEGLIKDFYPPAWLIVGDRHVPGMYLSFGAGEYLPDRSKLPVVVLSSSTTATVIVGAGSIKELTPAIWAWDTANAPVQRLSTLPIQDEPTAFTLSTIPATTPQFLEVFVQFENLETVSYGWKIIPQPE